MWIRPEALGFNGALVQFPDGKKNGHEEDTGNLDEPGEELYFLGRELWGSLNGSSTVREYFRDGTADRGVRVALARRLIAKARSFGADGCRISFGHKGLSPDKEVILEVKIRTVRLLLPSPDPD